MSENCFLCDFSLPSKKFFRKYTKNPPPHQIPQKTTRSPEACLGGIRMAHPHCATHLPPRRSEVSAAVRFGGEAEAERRESAKPSALSPVLRRKPKCPLPLLFVSGPCSLEACLGVSSAAISAKPRIRPAKPFCTCPELLLGHTRKTGAGPRPAPVLRSREWGSNPRPFRYE